MVNVRERHRGSSYGTDAAEPAPEPDPRGVLSEGVCPRGHRIFRDTHGDRMRGSTGCRSAWHDRRHTN